MSRTVRLLVLLALGVCCTAVLSLADASGDMAVDLGVKDRANAYPSIAAEGSLVGVAWGASTPEGATDIYAAFSRDDGRTFTAPVRVNDDGPATAHLAGEQPPRIVLARQSGREPAIVVMWTAKAEAGTRLLSARSDDGGRTFSAPALVPGTDAPGNRGWESAAADSAGGVAALWLDHREQAPAGAARAHSEHQHVPRDTSVDGALRAQSSKLYFARLGDAASVRTITGGVCYCCKTAMTVDTDGRVYAAWRHVFAGNIRDIAFTTSGDGGRTFAPPVRVSEDRWVLEGCPENGPTLAVDAKRRVHVIWPTLVRGASASEPTLALFYAMSPDRRAFTARQQLPTEGVPRHAWMTEGPGAELIVVWDEGKEGTRRIALARGSVDPQGVVRFVRQPLGDRFTGTYPVVASTAHGAMVAWTSGPVGQTVIRVAAMPQ